MLGRRIVSPLILVTTVAGLVGLMRWDAGMQRSDLRYAAWRSADLPGVDFSNTRYNWLKHLDHHNFSHAKFCSAELAGCNFRYSTFSAAALAGADFTDSDFTGADLRGAVLQRAIMTKCVLREANLQDADLRSADLQSSVLFGADLSSANLAGAKFYGAMADDKTKWPPGFDVDKAGVTVMETLPEELGGR